MDIIPKEGLPLLVEWAPLFTQPTYRRFLILLLGAILTTGRRTLSNLLRTVGALAVGHASSYHRVLLQARGSAYGLAAALVRVLIRHYWPQGVIALVGDETVTEHRGKKVYGKGRHRDAVRSSHSYTAHRYGHCWVVLAVLVKFPWALRPWALPVLVDLYRTPEESRRHGRRHRTPSQRMQRLLRVLLRWFPERRFRFAGDGHYGSHAMARFALRQQGRLTRVSRFHADAQLYAPAPTRSGRRGRPRVKGDRRPAPQQVVATAQRQRLEVSWYGGGRRAVEVVSRTGYWYNAGHGLVRLRWVWVHDLEGTHRDEYFFSSDPALSPAQIIALYTGRWNIETTFQELRAYLGLESTRGWVRRTVRRATPCLFGLYSVVALLYAWLPAAKRAAVGVHWQGKRGLTFSDAITSVRRWLWQDGIFATLAHDAAFSKIPQELQTLLLSALSPAA